MRRLAFGAFVVLVGFGSFASVWAGCGGPEFTLAADGGGPSVDGAATDASGATDGNGATDGSHPLDGGLNGGDAGDAGATGGGDAGGGADAAGDAGGKGDGGPASFSCAALPGSATNVIFCSDFDEYPDAATNPPWNWAGAPTTPKGTDALDPTDYVSAPNGFSASTTLLAAGDTYTLAELSEDPLQSVGSTHIDYAFQLFVKSGLDDFATIPIADVTIGPSTGALVMQLQLISGNLAIAQLYPGEDGGQQSTSPVTVGAVAKQTWTHVEMLLSENAAIWTVSVTLGVAKPVEVTTPTTPNDATFEVDLGILGLLPPSSANTVVFDNVLVRAY